MGAGMDLDEMDVHIGAQLSKLRKARGLTKAYIGRVIGTSYQQITKYESGEARIAASTLYRLSDLLNVDMLFFFQDLADGEASASALLASVDGAEQADLPRLLLDPDIRGHVEALVRVLEVKAASKR